MIDKKDTKKKKPKSERTKIGFLGCHRRGKPRLRRVTSDNIKFSEVSDIFRVMI